MKMAVKYIRIILSTLHGYLLCIIYLLMPARKLSCSDREPNLIVSLTSYGRRISKTLRFSLLSMLHQTRMPDRIVVWLNEKEFTMDSIPSYLKKYSDKYGIEIKFCPDLKSFKKLIPSLKYFPNDLIVTIDDDLVYKRDLIRLLYEKHLQYPGLVICSNAHVPTFSGKCLLPYKQWNLNAYNAKDRIIFPLGGSGTLYPPHSLHSDVLDQSLFLNLAPSADDVWFWCMGLLNGTSSVVLGTKRMYMEIDLFYQTVHKYSSLKSKNLAEDMNDTQIKAVFDHYGLIPDKELLENMLH